MGFRRQALKKAHSNVCDKCGEAKVSYDPNTIKWTCEACGHVWPFIPRGKTEKRGSYGKFPKGIPCPKCTDGILKPMSNRASYQCYLCGNTETKERVLR